MLISDTKAMKIGGLDVLRAYRNGVQVWTKAKILANWTYSFQSLAPVSTDPGVTASSWTAGPVAAVGTYNADYATQPTMSYSYPAGGPYTTPDAAVAAGAYVTTTLTPNGAYFRLTTLSFDVARGGAAAPRGWVLRTSADNFATTVASGDVAALRPTMQRVTVDLSALPVMDKPLTIRLYIYTPGGSQTLEVDNFRVEGIQTYSAPRVRAVSTANTGSATGTTMTLAVPTGEVGDLLVLFVGRRGSTGTLTAPAGYDVVVSQLRGTAGLLAVYSRAADSTGGGTVDVTISAPNTHVCSLVRFVGPNRIDAFAATNNAGTTSSVQPSPGLTPTVSGTTVVRAMLMAIGGTSVTMAWDPPPTEFSYVATSAPSGTGNGAQSLASEPGPSPAAAVPARNVTSSAAQSSASIALAIAPGIPDPYAWWKADSLTGPDGTPVASWPDSSANGFAATQATAARQPILKTNVLNGQPVVRFATHWLNSSASASGGPNQTVFTVVSSVSPGTNTVRGASAAGGLQFRIVSGRPNLVRQTLNDIGSGTNTPIASGVAAIYATSYVDATSYVFYVNGAATGTNTVANQIYANTTTVIGGRDSGTEPLIGDLAELIVYNRILTTEERAAVTAYLSLKYAIPLATS